MSEKEIYDALYYYYYDVEKSVNYILSTLVMHNFDLINTLINQEQKLTTRPGKAKSKKLDQAPAVPDGECNPVCYLQIPKSIIARSWTISMVRCTLSQ